jgi:hypothetical protein
MKFDYDIMEMKQIYTQQFKLSVETSSTNFVINALVTISSNKLLRLI